MNNENNINGISEPDLSEHGMAEHNVSKPKLKHWLIAFGITIVVFYLMDHFVMFSQGLNLNLLLTPAQ